MYVSGGQTGQSNASLFLFLLLLSYHIVIDMLLSILLFCSGTYCTHLSRVGSLLILHMVYPAFLVSPKVCSLSSLRLLGKAM